MPIKIKKYNIQRISLTFKKIPREIAENFFGAAMIFLMVVSLIGGLIFYKYIFGAQNKVIEPSPDVLKFREDIYQNILIIWSQREEKFNENGDKTYLNPFGVPSTELTK